MANSEYLREIFLLTSLLYIDQFGEEKLWEFSLWLEHALGAIRIEKAVVKYEASQNFFKTSALNLLDVVAGGFRPEQVIQHLQSHHRHAEIYANEKIGTGNGVQGVYKRAVLEYYGQDLSGSLRGKHTWIDAMLNGVPA